LDLTAQPRVEGASAEPPHVGPSEESELKKDATDVVIVAGPELVVCEGKFFNGFNTKGLNEQLCSQRRQMRHLFLNRPSIRAYRHVAILPSLPTTAIDADVVLRWADIRDLAETLKVDHYVTDRLRNAVDRYPTDPDGSPYFEGTLRFEEMRKKCRDLGNKIEVGYVGGEAALLKLSLVEAENRQWRWRYPETGGRVTHGHWLKGVRWLEIVESSRGFGGGGGPD
jgi:hypothetical protein